MAPLLPTTAYETAQNAPAAYVAKPPVEERSSRMSFRFVQTIVDTMMNRKTSAMPKVEPRPETEQEKGRKKAERLKQDMRGVLLQTIPTLSFLEGQPKRLVSPTDMLLAGRPLDDLVVGAYAKHFDQQQLNMLYAWIARLFDNDVRPSDAELVNEIDAFLPLFVEKITGHFVSIGAEDAGGSGNPDAAVSA